MTEVKKFGGKGAGLVLLIKNQDLKYNVLSSDIIDIYYYEAIEKQFAIGKLASILNAHSQENETIAPYIPTELPTEIQTNKIEDLAENYKEQAEIIS